MQNVARSIPNFLIDKKFYNTLTFCAMDSSYLNVLWIEYTQEEEVDDKKNHALANLQYTITWYG